MPAIAYNAHQAGEGILFAPVPACLHVYLGFAHTCSVVFYIKWLSQFYQLYISN